MMAELGCQCNLKGNEYDENAWLLSGTGECVRIAEISLKETTGVSPKAYSSIEHVLELMY